MGSSKRHTDTQTESDALPISDIGSSKKSKEFMIVGAQENIQWVRPQSMLQVKKLELGLYGSYIMMLSVSFS